MSNGSPSNVELIFGLAGPVGADFLLVISALNDALSEVGYPPAQPIRLSRFLSDFQLQDSEGGIVILNTPEEERIRTLMRAGNALRRSTNDDAVLATLAARDISRFRHAAAGRDDIKPHEAPPIRRAYVLNSLKRPEEVHQLRTIYHPSFFLIGIVSPRSYRIERLARRIAADNNTTDWRSRIPTAENLLAIDEDERDSHGQKLRNTFALSDFFLEIKDESAQTRDYVAAEIRRFVHLIMGNTLITPRLGEIAMFHAYGAAMRSGALPRQVGAAVVSSVGDLVGVGCNDVPKAGGGLYWDNDHYDHRDIKKKRDSAEEHEEALISEILNTLKNERLCDENLTASALMQLLQDAQVMHLLEFSRATHAEMEAILAAGRNGVTVRDAELYTTTFPCHECAKIILASGIRRVIYIEPYPKSRIEQMFAHEISTDLPSAICRICGAKLYSTETKCQTCGSADLLRFDSDKCIECGKRHLIPFQPFQGVGPRRFIDLFSITNLYGAKFLRKDQNGYLVDWTPVHKIPPLATSYREHESWLIDNLTPKIEPLLK